MSLLGPESVRGVDPALFGRRYPADGVTDALDSSLACVEIAAEDLPWRFSPGPAGPNGPAPWLVLVVLEAAANPVRDARPNPTVRARIAELPDLAQSWAWAHVQAGAGSTVARPPRPRRLTAGTAYVAAVVPAFRGGVDAGLGRAPGAATSRAPAWGVADQGNSISRCTRPGSLRSGPPGISPTSPAGWRRWPTVRPRTVFGSSTSHVRSRATRACRPNRRLRCKGRCGRPDPTPPGPCRRRWPTRWPHGLPPASTNHPAITRPRSRRRSTAGDRPGVATSCRRPPQTTGSPNSTSTRDGAWRPDAARTTSGLIKRS